MDPIIDWKHMGKSRAQERGKDRDIVVVAVDASKEINDYALEWAVRNVIVKTTDSITLLALLPLPNPANANRNHQSQIHRFLACMLKKWGIHDGGRLTQTPNIHRGNRETYKINEICRQMMQQLCVANNVRQVKTQVKIVEKAQRGSVAMEAKELGATWIVLDRRLKNEGDSCLQQLQSNVVVIDHAMPKILRLNLKPEDFASEDIIGSPSVISPMLMGSKKLENDSNITDMLGVHPIYLESSENATTASSLGLDSSNAKSEASCSFSFSSTDPSEKTPGKVASRPLPYREIEGKASVVPLERRNIDQSAPIEDKNTNDSKLLMEKPPKIPTPTRRSIDSRSSVQSRGSSTQAKRARPSRSFQHLNNSRSEIENESERGASEEPLLRLVDRTSSIRRAISISIKQPPTPPPLCSICKHNAPIFGKPPMKFSYEEMSMATDGFSRENFLAEGGYGPVYRGVLPDGQVVAVKQHKVVSAQGASEFCSEIEVLSCAQHRNLVMLIGYCMEKDWLLVYEFACNGSLDKHLYGKEGNEVLEWEYRQKVATGAARGLRYLHEDCRVGCIVHRDLRPNNILLTHDFEAMVGDFGLARWQADGQSGEETRVIGTFGYLAPEYTQTGHITEKADVYSFGVLLLELLTGQKAIDLSKGYGQQYLPEWARPLLENRRIHDLIDPRLKSNYSTQEVQCMMYVSSLCISSNPQARPRMSKVLRILEGDMPADMLTQLEFPYMAPPSSHKSSRRTSFGADRSSRKIWNVSSNQKDETRDRTLQVKSHSGPLHIISQQVRHQSLSSNKSDEPLDRYLQVKSYSGPLHANPHSPSKVRYQISNSKTIFEINPRSNADRDNNHPRKNKPRPSRTYIDNHDAEGMNSGLGFYQGDQHEMSEEFQTYLQGSLAEFIHKMKERNQGSSTTLALSDYGYPGISHHPKRTP